MNRLVVVWISLFGVCWAQGTDVSVKSEMIYNSLQSPTRGMIIPDLEYSSWVEGKLPFLVSVTFYSKSDDGYLIQLVREEKKGEYYYLAKFDVNATRRVAAPLGSQRALKSEARRLTSPEIAQLLYEYFTELCLSSRYGVRVEPEFPLIYVSSYSHPAGVISGYTSGLRQEGRVAGLPKVIESLIEFIDKHSSSDAELRTILKAEKG